MKFRPSGSFTFALLGMAFLLPVSGQDEKKKPAAPVEKKTYKQRVSEFWKWYASRAEFFHKTIEEGKAPDLAPEVSKKVNEYLPGLAWVFGPGKDGKGHSFTLSPEGSKARLLLTEFWVERAPKLEGWTFYEARQPGKLEHVTISIDDQTFDANEALLRTKLDEKNQKIDISVWHPKFSGLNEDQQMTITFIWLDQALGEKGTGKWIGAIAINKEKEKPKNETVPLPELPQLTKKLQDEKKWHTKTVVGQVYRQEPEDGGFRSDIFLGNTGCFSIIDDYLKEMKPAKDDPVEELGADFVFLAIDRKNEPPSSKDTIEFRGSISDKLIQALGNEHLGMQIGGATGNRYIYIDLLIYDGENSIAAIRKVIESLGFKHSVSIEPFYESFGKGISLIEEND